MSEEPKLYYGDYGDLKTVKSAIYAVIAEMRQNPCFDEIRIEVDAVDDHQLRLRVEWPPHRATDQRITLDRVFDSFARNDHIVWFFTKTFGDIWHVPFQAALNRL